MSKMSEMMGKLVKVKEAAEQLAKPVMSIFRPNASTRAKADLSKTLSKTSGLQSEMRPEMQQGMQPALRPSKSFGKKEMPREKRILLITLLVSAVLLALSALVGNQGIMANAILLSTMIVATPQFLFLYEKYKELKSMEERFPSFLRDTIESLRSGTPLHKSIIISSSFDYGKLSAEIRKMANQLTWGIPLEKVLEQFAERLKSSKRLYTSIKIIREAHLSGGDTISTIETVANNSNILEESEKERRSVLSQYVILMYAIAFIFIGIVVAINRLMIPIFEVSSATSTGTGFIGISNPCTSCYGFSCMVCGIYGAISNYIFSVDPASIASYYISLFFVMSVIQAIFSGLVAGQIGESSIVAGIKHSLILTSITFGAFYFLVYLGFLGA